MPGLAAGASVAIPVTGPITLTCDGPGFVRVTVGGAAVYEGTAAPYVGRFAPPQASVTLLAIGRDVDYDVAPDSAALAGTVVRASTDPSGAITGLVRPDGGVQPLVMRVGPTAAEFIEALGSAPEGAEIHLTPGATYLIADNQTLFTNKSVKIVGNEATLRPATPATYWQGSRVLFGANGRRFPPALSGGVLSSPVAVSAGQQTFAFPSDFGYVPIVGDILVLMSQDLLLPGGTYRHGAVVTITAASGLSATLNEPFYAGFSVTQIYVQRPISVGIYDLNFDMSGVVPGTSFSSFGVVVDGGLNPEIENCQFLGNDHAQVAILLNRGQGGVVRRCAISSFWNIDGIGGGSRLGYGVLIANNNVVVEANSFHRCKHAVAASPRDFVVLAPTMRDNRVTEDPADIASSVGGSLDTHAGVRGVPVFENNQIHCLKQAFNIRNGAAIVRGNTVTRIGADLTAMFSNTTEAPYSGLMIEGNTFNQPANVALFTRTWGATDTVRDVAIVRNTINGGRLLSISLPSGANVVDWRIEGNEIVVSQSSGNALISFTGFAGGAVSNLRVVGNTVRQSGDAEFCAFIANAIGEAKLWDVNDLEIAGNVVYLTSASATRGVFFNRARGARVRIRDNLFVHTAAGAGLQCTSSSIADLEVSRNRLSGANLVFSQNVATGTADNYLNCVIADNSATGWSVTDSLEDLTFTGVSRFTGNNILVAGSGRPVLWTVRSGSGSWAAMPEFLFANNTVQNDSGVGCVQLNVNSVGQKIVFRCNALSSPIEDQSATWYGLPLGNSHRAGTQSWRGGTTFRASDSTLRATAAPTSGTWAVGEIVWNNAPSNSVGQPIGWVCVVAGAPGTWRAFGVTA